MEESNLTEPIIGSAIEVHRKLGPNGIRRFLNPCSLRLSAPPR